MRLEGEIGTVAPVAPGARIDDVPLAEAPEIGAAHAAFYDDAYFEAKTGGSDTEVPQDEASSGRPWRAMRRRAAA